MTVPVGGPGDVPAGSRDLDLLVVGAGPVGLAAAIEARLGGLSVAVVEPRVGAVDKACGEGLMPGAVAALARLGVHPAGRPFAGIAYRGPRHGAEHRFRAGPGLGVRRTTLHAALATRAEELGVERVVARVDSVVQDGSGVDAAGLRAGWLLGCDGLHSVVRQLTGLSSPPARTPAVRRYGLRRHYRLAAWSDLVEVHWGPHAEAYVTPVAEDLVGVAVLGPRGTSYEQALDTLPELRRRLAGAPADGPVRGAGPLRQGSRARVAGRVLLVGDASGYVDALTGEGVRVGLAQARAAVASVRRGRPQEYERAWARASRDVRVLTGALLAAATRPRSRALIVPAAARLPRVFAWTVERLAR